MVDGTGTSSWLYDNADNVTKLTTPQGVMDYVYDQWNRKTSLKEGTIETQYAYSQGRLSSVNKSNDGVSTGLFYDSYGRLDQKIDGMTKTTYGYDTNDRLNSIVHARTSDNYALHQETYNYDYANNLMSKVVNSVATNYTYDEIDQLKTENGGGIANFYNYDANGNRTSKNSNTDFETYAYDDADKLLSVTRVTHASTNYTYDACGRPTNIGTKILTWDYEDRLTSLNGGGTTASTYGYNGVGTRVSKSNSNGSRTYKRNGVGVTAPVLSDGVSTMVPGISEKPTGVGTNTILTDRLGSMKGMANAGNVTETAEFDAFGKVVAHTLPSATQKGFASGFGYQEDGESGYKLLGHRYYDPETGRFLSRDKAKDGRNWYAYCENNPLKRIDPTGLSSLLNPANAAEAAACLAEIDGVAVGAGAAVALTPYEMAWGAYLGWFLRLPPSIQFILSLLGITGPYAATSPRFIPNPYGCKGKPDHQQGIGDWGESIIAGGGKVESGGGVARTIMYPMSNGRQQAPDGVAILENGTRRALEVGRTLKDGGPNMREFIKIGNLLDSGFDDVDWGGLERSARLGGKRFGSANL